MTLGTESEVLVLLDFYASWCIQCCMQRDCLEQVAGDYPGQLQVERVDIDADPEAARRHGVCEVPTLVLLRGDTILERVTGAQPCERLKVLVAHYLSIKTQ